MRSRIDSARGPRIDTSAARRWPVRLTPVNGSVCSCIGGQGYDGCPPPSGGPVPPYWSEVTSSIALRPSTFGALAHGGAHGSARVLANGRRPRDDRIRHWRGGGARHARGRRFRVEQRARGPATGARNAARWRPLIRAHRDERGLVMVETLPALVMVVPLLFGVIEFGWLFQRWLATETVAAHAARYAGELGGDDPALRTYIARALGAGAIDPARVSVQVGPVPVSWREPVRVSIRSQETIALPFLFTAPVTISATAIARGEVAR